MNPPLHPQRILLGFGPEVCSPYMARRVYVLTLSSGSIATNATVGHNSSLGVDRLGRILYQNPSNRIVDIELVVQRESAGFKYHESSQDGREALVAAPNTHITHIDVYTDADENASPSEPRFYLQTNESNIVEYRFEGHNYTVYNTQVIYAG